MKKLVLVLGIATLFSCEKEEENKVCDCISVFEQKMTENGYTYNPKKDINQKWYWKIIDTFPNKKDFCDNASIMYYNDSVDVVRYICK